jgi:hypothetical protein
VNTEIPSSEKEQKKKETARLDLGFYEYSLANTPGFFFVTLF